MKKFEKCSFQHPVISFKSVTKTLPSALFTGAEHFSNLLNQQGTADERATSQMCVYTAKG